MILFGTEQAIREAVTRSLVEAGPRHHILNVSSGGDPPGLPRGCPATSTGCQRMQSMQAGSPSLPALLLTACGAALLALCRLLQVGHGVIEGTPEESVGLFCELARQSADILAAHGMAPAAKQTVAA